MPRRRKRKKAKGCACGCGGTKAACDLKARASKLIRGRGGNLASKRSKTGDPMCSQAMSDWKTTGMTPAIAAVLGKCRSKARMQGQANTHRAAGNEARAQVLERRADRGLNLRERAARAKELRAGRAQPKPVAAPARFGLSAERVASLREPYSNVPKPRAAKPAATTPKDTAAELRAIRDRAQTMEPAKVRAEIERVMARTSAKDAADIQREFLGANLHGKNKKKALAAIRDRIEMHRAQMDRSDQIRGASAPATAPAKPSLREQADAARRAKGSVEKRLDRAVDRTLKFGKPSTYDGRKRISVETPTSHDYHSNHPRLALEQTRKGSTEYTAYRHGYRSSPSGIPIRYEEPVADFPSLKEAKQAARRDWREAIKKRAARLAGARA